MSFPRDAYPYTNFHELNLGYFIVHFREIFSQWADLYDQMLNWKNATDEELATWKAGVEADLNQREAALRAELETWKAQTGQDIAGWEDATLAALTAWQTATQAVFEAIRVEAAGSASAAAASAGDAATAKTAAETAQAAAEAAATSVQASAAQITTNTEDIADLKTQIDEQETAIFDILSGENVDIKSNPRFELGIIRGRNIGSPSASTTNAHSTPEKFNVNFTVKAIEGYSFVIVVHNANGTFNTTYPDNWTTGEYSTNAITDDLSGKLVSVEIKKTAGGDLSQLEDNIVTIEKPFTNNIAFIEDLQNAIGIDLTDIFNPGMWNSNGTYTETQTQSQYSTDIIGRNAFNKIYITPKTGYMANAAYFDGNTFISRGLWVAEGSTLEIDNTHDVSIIITKDGTASPIPVSEMLTHYEIKGASGYIGEEIDKNSNAIDFMYKIMDCDTNAKVLHFSFDDVISLLIALNTETYTSIFDHYILSSLKTLHDSYGCVFTLNCFCSNSNGFDITDMTTLYQSEFQANKDWLRFSFHAENSTANYSDETTYDVSPAVSYANFVTGIYKLTGDYDCIDRFARLGYFGGSLEIVNSLRSLAHGIIGLYTADDTRASYYLDAAENVIVRNKGKYFDNKNAFIFIRSLPRLDNNTAQVITDSITLPYQKYTEVFGHEWSSGDTSAMVGKLEGICEWAEAHGYEYGYFDKIFE